MWPFSRRDLLPREVGAALGTEGVLVRHGNVSMTLRLRDYRAPGRYSRRRVARARGALVVTRARLLVHLRRRLLDAAYDDPAFDALDLRATDTALVVGYDAGAFDEHASGRVEVTCRVPDPAATLERVRDARRAVGQ